MSSRHTAPFVCVRLTTLRTGSVHAQELFWGTWRQCTELALDEPCSTKWATVDIEDEQWLVKSRAEWAEMLVDVGAMFGEQLSRIKN